MANRYKGRVTLRGSNSQLTTLLYHLTQADAIDEGDGAQAAFAQLAAIVAALDPITEAVISGVTLALEAEAYDDAAVPAPGDSTDVFEAAGLSVFINATGEAEKFATINVPAPAVGIFQGVTGNDRDMVDRGDVALQAYVDAVADNATVSDGETINTSEGEGGISKGRRVVRKRRLGI